MEITVKVNGNQRRLCKDHIYILDPYGDWRVDTHMRTVHRHRSRSKYVPTQYVVNCSCNIPLHVKEEFEFFKEMSGYTEEKHTPLILTAQTVKSPFGKIIQLIPEKINK